MMHSAQNMLTAYHMVSEGDHVICAVSGGRDSIALLHCMAQLAPSLKITVSAAHFNHCLRGTESDRDEAFVRRLCEDLQIPLQCGRADVKAYAEEHRLGTEEAARILRYQFLISLDPRAKVATAHNADDNLETLLMHMVRGCGLHGLGGIPPVRDHLIRPLLNCDRSVIEAYLEENHLSWVEDSTNAEDDYLRNRIRHHVLPQLASENPSVSASASSMALTLRKEDAFIDKCAENAFHTLSPRPAQLDVPGLLSQPEALRPRILQKFLRAVPELTETHITAALALCLSDCPSGRVSLPGGHILRRNYTLLKLTAAADSAPEALTALPLPISGTLQWGEWIIETQECISLCQAPKGTLAVVYNPEQNYTIRPRQSGDRLTLPGGTKKLSRYLIDRKVPLVERDRIPVLCIDDTPAAVLPLAVSVHCRPHAGQQCLMITVKKMEDFK